MPHPPKSLVRNIAHTLGTNVLLVPLSFLLSILIARFLGPAGKGAYDLFVATGTLLGTAVGFSLTSGLVYVVAMASVRMRAMVRAMVGIVGGQTAIALLILFAAERLGFLDRFLPPDIGRGALMLCAGYVLLTLAAGYWRSMLIGRQDIVWTNRIVLFTRVTELAVAGILVMGLVDLDSSPVRMILIGMLASQLLSNALLLARVFRRLPRQGAGESGISAVVRYSAPNYLGNLSQFLVYRLDLFLVGYFVGQQGVGLYALAASLAQLLWLPAQAASTALLPDVASQQDAARRNARVTARATRITLLLCAGAALCLAVGVVVGLPIVYGQAFRPAITPLLLLLPGIVLLGGSFVTSSYIAAIGRPHLNMWISMVSLALTALLDVLLIPRFGINGAAVASTISYSTGAVVTFWVFARHAQVPMRTVVHERGELLRLVADAPQLLLGRPQNVR